MEPVAVVTLLILAQYLFIQGKVGQARGKHDIKAPAVTGNTEFESIFRIHQNTVEQLVVLLPSMWLFMFYVHALGAAALGFVFLIGRFVYFSGYSKDPSKRAAGFLIGYVPTVILLLGGLGGAIWKMIQ